MMTLALRPYQQAALDAIEAAWLRGIRRQLLALPTGAGKTIVFAQLVASRPGRALVLAHRDELIQQAADKLRMVAPALPIGLVKAERDESTCPVIVASVQTLSRPHRLARLTPDIATIIIDEAHHACAESYRRILAYLGAFAADGPLTLGVTATPERGDLASLGDIFEEIVYEQRILDLIPEYLCDLTALQVRLKADFHRLHTRLGEIVTAEAEELLCAANAPAHVAEAYYTHALGRKALIFTPTVKTAHAMVDAFRQAGDVPIEAVDGETPAEDRRAILQRFRTGETQILANCAVLTEGYDEPSVNCIIVARPTKSKVLYAQMIGRGCRHYPGKADCLIIDVVGVTDRFDLMTFAGLFGVTPKPEQTLTEARRAREAAQPHEIPVPGDLVTTSVDLFRQRPLHWVLAGHGRFALSTGDGILYLEPMADQPDRWRVRYKARNGERHTLQDGLDLGYAQGFAEDYVRRLGAGGLVNPKARWRQLPATPKQLEVLRRARVPIRPGLTKGEASDLISAAAVYWQ